jgi:hypothetical protein
MHIKHKAYTWSLLAVAIEALGVAALIVVMTYAVPLGHALMQP